MMMMFITITAYQLLETKADDDVYYYIRWRLKLEGETENMGVCTKERSGGRSACSMLLDDDEREGG